MKKIIITGGAGFVGSRFKKMWEKEYIVLNPGSKELDVTDEAAVRELILGEKPDYVLHMAGIPNQQFCIEHPELAHAVNVDGSIYVAKACKEVGAKLVFISTEQIFNGSEEPGPYTEESTPVPNTVYGENKLEVEKLLPEYIDECWILRFTWVFGLPERGCKMGANILWDTIDAVIKNKTIVTTEYEFRGMTDVKEICANLVKVFDLPYGTYHFGTRNDCGRYEIVKHIMTEMGVPEEVIAEKLVIDNSKFNADNRRELRLDNAKITELGITFTPTKEAITSCLKEFSMI